MKKIFRNNRIISLALLSFFSAAITFKSIANDSSRVAGVELKFSGLLKNDPLFQLSVAGGGVPGDFMISITDEEGVNLYEEYIHGEGFTKKFLLNTEELGDATLRFEIINRKSKQVVVYEVNSLTHEVRETGTCQSLF